jgi:hypothetical protein
MATRHLQLLCLGLLITAIGVLLSCSPALAGTINLLSGELTFTGSSNGSVNLVGDRGFTFNAVTSALDANVGPFQACDFIPCAPGTPISLHVSDVGTGFFGGHATLDGVTYPDVSGVTNSSAALLMQFDGNPAIAPPVNVASVVALTNSVTFTGLFSNPTSGTENLLASAEATVVLDRATFCPFPGDCWHFVSATYDLSPVPEPATLLLWGTTMAGLGLVARMRRHPELPPRRSRAAAENR